MDELLGGVEGVLVFMDDILIATPDIESHLVVLERVFGILEKYNLKISAEKSQFIANKIEFLGHMLSREGIRPMESKIQALLDTPIPTDAKALHSFLGMISYYSKFLANMSARARVVFRLIRKNVEWVWTQELTDRINEFKTELSQNPRL